MDMPLGMLRRIGVEHLPESDRRPLPGNRRIDAPRYILPICCHIAMTAPVGSLKIVNLP